MTIAVCLYSKCVLELLLGYLEATGQLLAGRQRRTRFGFYSDVKCRSLGYSHVTRERTESILNAGHIRPSSPSRAIFLHTHSAQLRSVVQIQWSICRRSAINKKKIHFAMEFLDRVMTSTNEVSLCIAPACDDLHAPVSIFLI